MLLTWWLYTAVLDSVEARAAELLTPTPSVGRPVVPARGIVRRVLRWLSRRYSEVAQKPTDAVVTLVSPGLHPLAELAAADGERKLDATRWSLRHQWLTWTFLLLSLVAGVVLAVSPFTMADRFGVIAVFQWGPGSLTLFVATVVVLLQPSGAPECFWWTGSKRLAATPITTLVLAVCLVPAVSPAFDGDRVHPVRQVAEQPMSAADRPSMAALFDAWKDGTIACDRNDLDLPDGLAVRPLILYAAEGGGIRAAYWTASAVDRLARSRSAAAGAPSCPAEPAAGR